MPAGKYTLHIEQGATLRRTFQVTNPPVSFPTNFTARMQVRNLYETVTPSLTLTTENGGIVLTDLGEVKIYASANTTASLTHDGVYDIELITPTGEIERFLQGSMRLSLEATRIGP